MSIYVRVYDPINNEPFDVPKWKADELRLEHGWNTQPFEIVPSQDAKKTEALIQDVEEVVERSRRPSRSGSSTSDSSNSEE